MPAIPWRAATRMRDPLVHHYFDISLAVLQRTIAEDLPQLLAILPSEDEPDRRRGHVNRRRLGDEPRQTPQQVQKTPGEAQVSW